MFRKIIFIISLLIIFGALFYKIGLNLIKIRSLKPTNFNDIKILGLDQEENVTQKQNLSLHVISANLIADFEPIPTTPTSSDSNLNSLSSESSQSAMISPTSPPLRIKSLRILGELENNGREIVRSTTPVVTFYDAAGQKIAVKVPIFSDGYIFPILEPNEKFFYDVVVQDLPSGFQNLTIVFKASSASPAAPASPPPPISKLLKIESRDIEENIATASAGDQNYYYYRLKGKMISTGGKSIKNASVIAYAKDKDDRVFAWNKQAFPSDLFSKNESADINILITPLKNDRAENFEVYFFGEEL